MNDQQLTDKVRAVLQRARASMDNGPAPVYYRHDEAKAWKAGVGFTIEAFYRAALAEARGLPTVDLPTPQEMNVPTDRRDREQLTAARRSGVGRTLIPRDAGWKADFELGPRDGGEYLDHVREAMLRRLHRAITDAGVSTTLDIVRLNAGEVEGPGQFGPTVRWTFPRPYPDTDDPLRIDGGHHHGQQMRVPPTWDRLALLDEEIELCFYALAGFDAGTGEWVYRPAGKP